MTCFEQALVALQHLPESQDTQRQGIDLRLELREALHPLGAIAQMRTALHEAETLAEAAGRSPAPGADLPCRVPLSFQMGDYGRGLASGQRALAIGEALGDVASNSAPITTWA